MKATILKEKFINIDGSEIRYLESGSSKKTLLLIHGLGASCERWEKVLPIFEKELTSGDLEKNKNSALTQGCLRKRFPVWTTRRSIYNTRPQFN